MSRYLYKVLLLIIYSLFSGAHSVFSRLRIAVRTACTPPPPGSYVHTLSWSALAFLFLLSHPTGRSEENSRTLQPLVGICCAFNLPTHPFQPQAWRLADREGGVCGCWANIVTYTSLGDSRGPLSPPHNPQRWNGFLPLPADMEFKAEERSKQPSCTCLAHVTCRCLLVYSRPSSVVKYQKHKASAQVDR